ncbi:sensor histidine kinase [Sulfitobacter sp. F26169L]|uniref:sensor histidine kinase n=1 Tax=Sulfitobacter sp. F26169L TaxID=2996015 RepID=UPI002260FF4F|nr:sensor histidine kinase [Sulfitobacter sp. F26169L]MCX7566581.1 sensor histidine kinase [Sulfitobacter sp. F26169L]
MTSGFLHNRLFGGLAFRVLLFLSLALLPIGLIAFQQTRQIADQSEQAAELSLMAVTEQAAAAQRTVLQEAIGAGRVLASVVKLVRNEPVLCSNFLTRYKAENSNYQLVGFAKSDGSMKCSSTGQEHDVSDSEVFRAALENTTVNVHGLDSGAISKRSVVVVTVPVFEDEAPVGFVFISIKREVLNDINTEADDVTPLSLVTYNTSGQIVTTEQRPEVFEGEMPAAYSLKQLTGNSRQVFTANSKNDAERVYAVIPVIQGSVFAISVWPTDTPLLQTDFTGRVSSLLPILMWVASLVVAFWALNRLAITHIKKLGRQMRHFALNRTLPRKSLGDRLPFEIVAMEESFMGMARSILHDEARLEDSLREKNILLKEVHHRVKNNLQLISSIMNMQIRQAPTEANRQVLKRLQDRILSLATVHKSLYQDNEMTRVDAAVLLREIVSRNLAVGMSPNAGIDVSEDYDCIFIGPDDAAPLSLLVSEAVTNALKYLPQRRADHPKISVSLRQAEPERAVLRISNTTGTATPESGTGLGSKLIQAFARQLNGTLEISEGGPEYILELSFPVPLTDKETYDY